MKEPLNGDLAEFFAQYPLYRTMRVATIGVPPKVPIPAELRTELFCRQCGCARSFALLSRASHLSGPIALSLGSVELLLFDCTHCQKQSYRFTVHVRNHDGAATIQKVGQHPPHRPEVEPALRPFLDAAHTELYQKGLTAEGHGFGIGAFAYYRRVTEDIMDALLDSLAEFCAQTGSQALTDTLALVAAQQHASDKIRAVKDLLPGYLCPGGFNPLGKLYELLSTGIHSLSDDECLECAEALRTVLVNLIATVSQQRASQAAYEEAASKLLHLSSKLGQRQD